MFKQNLDAAGVDVLYARTVDKVAPCDEGHGLDVVLEDLLQAMPGVERVHDEPALAGGWFRLVRLRRRAMA